MGLRKRFSKKLNREVWGYRFWLKGRCHSGETGLPATARNRPAAEQMRADYRARVISGKMEIPRAIPFSEAAEFFLEWSKDEHSGKPNTWKRHSASLASLKHCFNERPLDLITPGDLEDYKSWRRRSGIKEVTIRHDLHALSQLFQFGRKHRLCEHNPVREIKLPSDKDSVNERILTGQEERAYFEAAKSRPALYDWARLMILQGPRPDEALSILKENVDPEQKTLKILIGKSRAARRTLHLADEAVVILGRRLPGWSPWVFPSPRTPERSLTYSGLVSAHNRVLISCGLDFDVYSFRHTFATRFYQETKDIASLAKVLGHADLRTVQRYIHVTEEHVKKAMRRYQQGLQPMGVEVLQ